MKVRALTTLVAVTVTLGFLSMPQSASASADAALAVLMNTTGQVTVVRADGKELSGTLGLDLFSGDEVQTGVGGAAEIYFSAGHWVQLGANSRSQIGVKPSSAKSPATDEEGVEVVQNFLKLRSAEGTSTINTVRSGSNNAELVSVLPQQALRHHNPTFVWRSSDASLELELLVRAEGRVIWSANVTGKSELVYPQDAPALAAGKTYDWLVRSTDPLFGEVQSEATFFTLLDSQAVTALTEALDSVDKSKALDAAARHLVRSRVFFKYGLIEDAIAEIQSAASADPDNEAIAATRKGLMDHFGIQN